MQNAFVDPTPVNTHVSQYCDAAQNLVQTLAHPTKPPAERHAEVLEAMQQLERQFTDLMNEIQAQDHALAMMQELTTRSPSSASGVLVRPTGYPTGIQPMRDAADLAAVTAQDDIARAQARTSRYPQIYSLLTAQRSDPMISRLLDRGAGYSSTSGISASIGGGVSNSNEDPRGQPPTIFHQASVQSHPQ